MIVEFDTSRFCSTRAKDEHGSWWRVLGSCLRCGKCCLADCADLNNEVLDGVKKAKCVSQFYKPFMCAMYPYNPDAPLKDGCGFKWEKE